MTDIALAQHAARYSSDEMMTIAAARYLHNGMVCFVGIGLPSEAANLARLTHAPDLVLIYESGTIAAKPSVLPLSIGDGELAETATSVVSVPEIFGYWLQGGRIDVGFLSAAQIDRFGNLNSTVIGTYESPRVRLPGAGGAPEIAAAAKEVVVMLKHQRRTFVEAVDFVTSVGFGQDGDGRPGCWGAGPTSVITDLGVLTPNQLTHELELTALHPGATIEEAQAATGWPLVVATGLVTTASPSEEELGVLRGLKSRTAESHTR